jgi:hypothetical protein
MTEAKSGHLIRLLDRMHRTQQWKRAVSGFPLQLILLAGVGLVSETLNSASQSEQPNIPLAKAARVDSPITLDGQLTEPAWSLAEPVREFLQRDPDEGAPASEGTEVRILFDSLRIYLGVICSDSDPSAIRATELRRDNALLNDDIFEVLFDTLHDHRSAYLFRINPNGTQYDETITNEGAAINNNWDERWEVKTRITEEGWQAEMAIPFKAMRFSADRDSPWGVNFHRTIKRKNEDVFWTAHNRGYLFAEVSRAGHLLGLADIRGFRMRFRPYATLGAKKEGERGQEPTRHLTDAGIEDAKYMITPQLALDLMVNPDFAQADVDEAQINLTRFSLLFPERREFFQEGSGIFRVGTADAAELRDLLTFQTRRIGLSEDRQEIPIIAGMKVTGRQGGVELGLLNVQTDRGEDAPGQNFSVVRVKRSLLARSFLGGIYTRNTGSPLGGSNQLFGIDSSLTFHEHLNFQALAAKTSTASLEGKDWAGYGVVAWVTDKYVAQYERLDVGENFRPEMGFVSRLEPGGKGIDGHFGGAEYNPRPAIPWVRQVLTDLEIRRFANQDGLLETRAIQFEPGIIFESGDIIESEVSWFLDRLVRPFEIRDGDRVVATIPPGGYATRVVDFSVETFGGRAISGTLSMNTGGYYNGTRTTWSIAPEIKPTKNLSLLPNYSWGKVSLPDVSFRFHELNAAISYSFSQKWLTRTTVILNSQDRGVGLNFRLNYIIRPGDDLFFVYNEARLYGDQGGLHNRSLIAKVAVSFDY